jgi:hypothetical protein
LANVYQWYRRVPAVRERPMIRWRFYVKLTDDRLMRLPQSRDVFPTLAGQTLKAIEARWDEYYRLEIIPTTIKFDQWGRRDALLEERKRTRVRDLRTLLEARDLRDHWSPSDQDEAAIKADIQRQKTIPVLHE